jgi:hypothetical protein
MTLDKQLELAKARGVSVEDQLYISLQQQSAQEKFNQTIEKLQDMLVTMVNGPLGQFLDKTATILNNTKVITTLFVSLSGLIGGKLLLGMTKYLTQMAFAVGLAKAEAVAKITTMNAVTLGLGAIGAIAGIATVVAAMNSASDSVKDGIIGPDDRILYSGNKGSIKFDKNDTIVAGTDLMGGNKNSDVERKLDKMIMNLEKIYSKDTNVYLSESKLALATATPIGTNLQKTSYNIA